MLRNIFKKNKTSALILLLSKDATNEEIIYIPNHIMNAVYDRSAGRWCMHCNMNGSHHSDRHNAFAVNAFKKFKTIKKV